MTHPVRLTAALAVCATLLSACAGAAPPAGETSSSDGAAKTCFLASQVQTVKLIDARQAVAITYDRHVYELALGPGCTQAPIENRVNLRSRVEQICTAGDAGIEYGDTDPNRSIRTCPVLGIHQVTGDQAQTYINN